jgi:hypothetical protein
MLEEMVLAGNCLDLKSTTLNTIEPEKQNTLIILDSCRQNGFNNLQIK